MALLKTITQDNGISCSYWMIDNIDISWKQKECSVVLKGYVSKEKRDENITYHIMIRCFNFDGDAFDFPEDGILVESLYEKIKSIEEWSDVEDA